jgi:isopentenyl phosphate kinase
MNIQFLKLGGSLITDKNRPQTPRSDTIARLAEDIARARNANPDLSLVLGHGSGSFGHVAAKKFGTHRGVDSVEGWHGFAEVWHLAATLNHIVVDTLHTVGLPAITFPASAGAIVDNGRIKSWNLTPLRTALETGLMPVVYGDVVFDSALGGTILSTEDLFAHLAGELHPKRILIAGIEDGAWADYPDCTQLIPEITPENWAEIEPSLGGSAATDVTGGMASKVRQMLDLAVKSPGTEIFIFNGNQPHNVESALQGHPQGTRLVSAK